MSAIPVLIMMTSCPHGTPDPESETVRTSMVGTIEQKGDSYILCYTEQISDDTGVIFPRDVTVTMRSNSALMEARGEYGMTLFLEKGRRFEGTYQTPFGDMSLAIYTTALTIQPGTSSGKLFATYQLDTGADPMALDITLLWRMRSAH